MQFAQCRMFLPCALATESYSHRSAFSQGQSELTAHPVYTTFSPKQSIYHVAYYAGFHAEQSEFRRVQSFLRYSWFISVLLRKRDKVN